MASGGIGSGPHLAGELFKMMTAVDMVHVQYRGQGPMMVDLVGGQVQVTFDGILRSLPYVRSGKLRALAVTGRTRSAALPDIPTLAESVPGYEMSGWYGIGVPKTRPPRSSTK